MINKSQENEFDGQLIEETISPETSSTKTVKYTNPRKLKSIIDRIDQIEATLYNDFRVGSGREGYLPYNGTNRSPGKFYGGDENPLTNSSGFRLNYDGRFYTTQMFSKAFFYTSDIAEKQNILPLENALEKIVSLQGVSFQWKDDSTSSKQAGVIAQEVKNVIPEAAVEIDGKYSVNASSLIGYLIESIKELKQEIEVLKNGKTFDKK